MELAAGRREVGGHDDLQEAPRGSGCGVPSAVLADKEARVDAVGPCQPQRGDHAPALADQRRTLPSGLRHSSHAR
eukprot:366410-Chlamydomonas_euryale.AAC.36